MKILVTGAAGFIGSHAVEQLIKRGHVIVGIDNLNDYYDPERKRANLAEITHKSFHFERLDVRDKSSLSRLFQERKVERIVHLAAMAGVRYSVEQPQLYLDVNLSGTLNLLELAKEHQIDNFVLASTSSAYGATHNIPLVETDPCDRPLAPYPASKRAAEMMAYSYHHLFGLNVNVLRFFTVYGPRGRPDMMAHKVLDNIFFGEPVQLFNGGQMWRDWTYIDDTVRGITAAIERPLGYEIINLGRGQMTLLSDFVNLLENLTQRKAHLESAPKMDADVERTLASIDKAKSLLDYEPQVSVAQGVSNFWDWYQARVLKNNTIRKT